MRVNLNDRAAQKVIEVSQRLGISIKEAASLLVDSTSPTLNHSSPLRTQPNDRPSIS